MLKKFRNVFGCIGLQPLTVVLLLYPFSICSKLKPSKRNTWQSWKRYLMLSSNFIPNSGFTKANMANKITGIPLWPVVNPSWANMEKMPKEVINWINSSRWPQELKHTSSYFFCLSLSRTSSWFRITILGVFFTAF